MSDSTAEKAAEEYRASTGWEMSEGQAIIDAFMAGRASRHVEVAEVLRNGNELVESLREQLAVEKAYRKDWENEGAVRWIELKDREKANAVAAVERKLAEAQATIEKLHELAKEFNKEADDTANYCDCGGYRGELPDFEAALSVPSSTGGNEVHADYESARNGMAAMGDPIDPMPERFTVIVDLHGPTSINGRWAQPFPAEEGNDHD